MITTFKTSSMTSSQKFRNMNATYVAPSGFELISTTVLGSAGTVTFSSIPQTYTNLQVRISGTGGGTHFGFRINGNATNIYYWQYIFVSGAAWSTLIQTTGTTFGAGYMSTAQSATIIDFFSYATMSNWTYKGQNHNSSNHALIEGMANGGSGAITSLTFSNSNGGNLNAGTRVSLYGVL